MGTAALLKSLAFSCLVLADFPANSPTYRLAIGDRITVTLFDPFSANRNCQATFVSSMRATSSYIRVNLVNP
jgi:protein involved in polysaccharide export with SLBB domain